MRFASDEASRRLYTEFLTRHARCNFQQSPEWAAVKSNWKNEIILAEDPQGNITGGLSVLIRKMPLFGSLMYSPRGPVCALDDEDSLRQLTEGAELLAWKYNAMALRMEPDVAESESTDFRRIMGRLGYRIGGRGVRCIQPRRVFRLDLRGKSEDDVLAGFKYRLRYNIRLSQRRGVTVREGTREDLPLFYALMEDTARRDGFLPRPLAYFQRMWDVLGPEHMTLLLAWHDGRPIAGAIPIHYGRRTWYAFGASSSAHRELMPSYLLQWEIIRRALRRGDEMYDLRGVLENTDVSNGLYLFKSRFGADLTAFVGPTVMAYRPVAWRAYCLAERAYMAARDRYTTRAHSRAPDGAPQPLPWSVPSPPGGAASHRPMSA